MSDPKTKLTYGQQIPWGNGYATVIRHNRLTNKVWIEFNGSQIQVDYNDIFGLNTKKQECLDYYDKRIAESNTTYEKYKIKIKLAKQQKQDCTDKQNWFQDLMNKILRKNKLETRIKYLKDTWNIVMTQDELNWLYSRKSVVKTHLANIIVNRRLANNNLEAMDKYLEGCKAGDTRFTGEEAINAIVSAGGIPVWAHPLGGEGEVHISEEEFYKRFEVMKKIGIQGLECHYSRYNKKEAEFLVKVAKENNLYITGGSDYHGSNKDIPLGKLNVENDFVDAENLTIFSAI